MRFEGKNSPPGEFASKALFKNTWKEMVDQWGSETKEVVAEGWTLSKEYYFSLGEAQKALGPYVKWPVEKYDESLVYVPAPEELK